MPFGAQINPVLSKYNNDKSIFVGKYKEYCFLNVYSHYICSKIERVIWIGFYKNDENNKCFINKLPKDLVIHILELAGKQEMIAPYIKISD